MKELNEFEIDAVDGGMIVATWLDRFAWAVGIYTAATVFAEGFMQGAREAQAGKY